MVPADAVFEAFYSYGYDGKDMMAVRAPFSMTADADEIIGQRVRIGALYYRVLAVRRQIHGPIPAGEPIGVEVRLEPAIPGEQP